jgi:hypothetical protein
MSASSVTKSITPVKGEHGWTAEAQLLSSPGNRVILTEMVGNSASGFPSSAAGMKHAADFLRSMVDFMAHIFNAAMWAEGVVEGRCTFMQLDGGYVWEHQSCDNGRQYVYLWHMYEKRCVESSLVSENRLGAIKSWVGRYHLNGIPEWITTAKWAAVVPADQTVLLVTAATTVVFA